MRTRSSGSPRMHEPVWHLSWVMISIGEIVDGVGQVMMIKSGGECLQISVYWHDISLAFGKVCCRRTVQDVGIADNEYSRCRTPREVPWVNHQAFGWVVYCVGRHYALSRRVFDSSPSDSQEIQFHVRSWYRRVLELLCSSMKRLWPTIKLKWPGPRCTARLSRQLILAKGVFSAMAQWCFLQLLNGQDECAKHPPDTLLGSLPKDATLCLRASAWGPCHRTRIRPYKH